MASSGGRFSELGNRTRGEKETEQAGYGPRNRSQFKRTGRPPGKSSNPEYTQVTSYMRREVYYRAKNRLNDEQVTAKERRDLSDVLDSLLEFYVEHGDPWTGART